MQTHLQIRVNVARDYAKKIVPERLTGAGMIACPIITMEHARGILSFYATTDDAEIIGMVEDWLRERGVIVRDGELVEVVNGQQAFVLNVPNESTFFRMLGMSYTPPAYRTREHFREFMRMDGDWVAYRLRPDAPKQRRMF